MSRRSERTFPLISRKRFATSTVVFAAVVIVAVGAFFGARALMDSGPTTWKPTAAESDLAIKVAQQEALTTVPAYDGSPAGTPTVDATG